MDPHNKQQIGGLAEQQAQDFLCSKGLKPLVQNYTCYGGEIDLIMQDQEDIVFVEVRYRANADYGNALESINQHKMNRLIKAAIHYLQGKKWLYRKNSRFDVIAIHPVTGKMQLEWIKNAFTVDTYR